MISSIKARLKIQLEWSVLPFIFLLVIIFFSLVFGISESVRGVKYSSLMPIAFAAFLYGWWLARSKSRAWQTVLLSIVLGLLLITIFAGGLWDEIGDLLFKMAEFSKSFYWSLVKDIPVPSPYPITSLAGEIANGIGALINRLVSWVFSFPDLKFDLIAEFLGWSLLVWFTIIWALWFLLRLNRPLVGMLPAFIILAFTISSSKDVSANYLLPVLGASLALMILVGQLTREEHWKEKAVGFSEIIRRNTIWTALLLSIVFTIASGVLSSIDLEEFIERLREPELVENTFGTAVEEALSAEEIARREYINERVNQFSSLTRGGLPTSKLIDLTPELGDEVVFQARVEELNPLDGKPIDVEETPIYYFRSLTYDTYFFSGWVTTGGRVSFYEESQAAILKYTSNQRLFQQEVVFIRDEGGLIVSVGDLASVDEKYSVAWRELTEGGQYLDMFGALIDKRLYRAFSLLPAFGEDELRNASQNYPDWVIDRYLQLPDDISDSVRDLARDLTFSENNPYDAAVAIEQYLRTFPYTLDLPRKPQGIDVAEYFLFDVQTGYCDYYATTMVVLARAVGIPSRLAVGYLASTYDEENNYYTVTANQAHSWVEIYFPDYGWVSFEPTAGSPAIERTLVREDVEEFEKFVNLFEERKDTLPFEEMLKRVIWYTLLGAVVGTMVWLRIDIWLLGRQSPEKVFSKLYLRLRRTGYRLKVETVAAHTPYEFNDMFKQRMAELARGSRFKRYLEPTSRQVAFLVELFVQAVFTPTPLRSIDRGQAVSTYRSLRWRLFFSIVLGWMQTVGKKISRFLEDRRF